MLLTLLIMNKNADTDHRLHEEKIRAEQEKARTDRAEEEFTDFHIINQTILGELP